MGLIAKLIVTPFVAYFLTLFTVAILGSVYGNAFLTKTLDGSALPVFLVWLLIIIPATILLHYFKRQQ